MTKRVHGGRRWLAGMGVVLVASAGLAALLFAVVDRPTAELARASLLAATGLALGWTGVAARWLGARRALRLGLGIVVVSITSVVVAAMTLGAGP